MMINNIFTHVKVIKVEGKADKVVLLSIDVAPSGTIALGSKYFNSTDSLIYEYKRIGNDAPGWHSIGQAQMGVIYIFDVFNYLWNAEGGMVEIGSVPTLEDLGGLATTSKITTANVEDAVDKKHSHSNKTVLDATEQAFTSSLKTAYDDAVTAVAGIETLLADL
jgi:hypothetical protein